MKWKGLAFTSELSLSPRNYPGKMNSSLGISKPASALMVLMTRFNRMHQYADFICIFGVIAKNAS